MCVCGFVASNRGKWLAILEAQAASPSAKGTTSDSSSQVKAMRRRTTAFNEVLMPVAAAASAAHGALESAETEHSVRRGLNALQTFVLAQG